MADTKLKTKDDFYKQMKAGSEQAREVLGWGEQGQKNLEGLQKRAFDYGASKVGAEAGQDANETAGNIVSKLTSGLGTSTAADVLRTGLQTGMTVGLDPQNIIAPGAGIRGTIAKVAERNLVKGLADDALKTGRMDVVNQIVKAKGDELSRMAQGVDTGIVRQQGIANRVPTLTQGPRVAHSQLGGGATHVATSTKIPAATAPGMAIGPRLSTNINATKRITGANEIIPRGIKPQNLPKPSKKDPDLDMGLDDLVARALAKKGQK